MRKEIQSASGESSGAMGVMNLKLAVQIPNPDLDDHSPIGGDQISKLSGHPFYRQHSRNRSLDSAQVLSCLHHHDQGRIGIGSPEQLGHHDSLSTKSNSPSVVMNDRILAMRQQHCCLYHDFRTVAGESHPDLPPTAGKLKCTCAANSDDSGICSGASGTTGSETDDLNCSVACDTYDDDDDDIVDKGGDSSVDSPRLSFDSAVLTDDHEGLGDMDVGNSHDVDCEEDALETSLDTVVLSKCLGIRRLSTSCDETVLSNTPGDGFDLDSTLINDELSTPCSNSAIGEVPISTLPDSSSSCSSALEFTPHSSDEMGPQQSRTSKEVTDGSPEDNDSVAAASADSTVNVDTCSCTPTSSSASTKETPSLLSRIRGNKNNNNNNSSPVGPNGNSVGTPSSSGATAANTSTGITAGVRNKLRLNFGKGKEKTKQQPAQTPLSALESSIETPKTPTTDLLNGVSSTITANIAVSIPGTSANVSCNSNYVSCSGEDESRTVEEVSSTTNDEVKSAPPSTQVAKPKSWLLRFFESQVFNMSYAIGYLFTSKEPGVQQYIGNLSFYSFTVFVLILNLYHVSNFVIHVFLFS